MLILVVVIAILATNLFMGFFIAHCLGYGPQNFQELWTGVYLRPIGPASASAVANRTVDRRSIDALTRAVAARLDELAERDSPGSAPRLAADASNKPSWTDPEVVKTIWRGQQMLEHLGMISDRWRLLDLPFSDPPTEWAEGLASSSLGEAAPTDAFDLGESAAWHWDGDAIGALLDRWRSRLHSIVWVEPVEWWKAHLMAWEVVQARWLEYQQTIDSLVRLQAAEQAFQREYMAVVCENGTCRRVSKVAAPQGWWQRPSAELQTLTWVHEQRERLHQELFDQWVAFEKARRDLGDRTLHWLRETFRPELLQETATELGLFSAVLAHSSLTDADPREGHLLILRWSEAWVQEFCWGSTVVAAYRQHADQRLQQWHEGLSDVLQGSRAGLELQQLNRATILGGIPSPEACDAEQTAWTMVNALVSDRRQVGSNSVDLPFRVILIPLTSRRPAAAALRLVKRRLEDEGDPLWEIDASPVWRWGKRGLEATTRPATLPCVPVAFDLVAWYTRTTLNGPNGEEGWTPGVTTATDPVTAANTAAGAVADPAENEDNTAPEAARSAAASDDDGIEW